jgi:hypothetical protein
MSENGSYWESLWDTMSHDVVQKVWHLFLRLFPLIVLVRRVVTERKTRKKAMEENQKKLDRGLQDVVDNPLFKAFLAQLLALVLDYGKEAVRKYLEERD